MVAGLWTQGSAGVILDAMGNAILCDDCPCVEIPITGCPPCTELPGIARCWEFAAAGFSDDECEECSNLNGTWTLKYDHDPNPSNPNTFVCSFGQLQDLVPFHFKPGSTCTRHTDGYWIMIIAGSGNYRLTFGRVTSPTTFQNLVVYKNSSAFNCNAANVMALEFPSVKECNEPASLTIEPVACP